MKPGEQDDLLKKFYEGNTSLEEEKQLLSFLQEDDETDKHQPEKDIAAFFEDEKKIKSKTRTYSPPFAGRSISLYYKIAASILLACAISWLVFEYSQESSAVLSLEAITLAEQRQVELPDGSLVTLNHNSRLLYPQQFAETREVLLEGEAYFEVARDEKRPFRVVAGNVTTEVLGTAFNLHWNKLTANVELEVTEGKVAFASFENGLSERIFVSAGEHAVYRGETNTIEKFEAFNPNLIAWKTKKLVFENAALEKVLSDAAGYFDVEFEITGEGLRNCNFSGKLDNPQIEDFLEALNYVLRINHEIRNDKIILMGDGC